MKKTAALALVFATLFFALTGCGTKREPESATFYDYFDTVITVSDYSGRRGEDFSELSLSIKAEYEVYHKLYDIYNEYDGINNLATLNRLAGEWVELDGRILDLLLYGKEAYSLTGGTVNIAMGSVLSLWHEARLLGRENPSLAYLPEKSALEAAAAHTDIDKIEIDSSGGRARLSDPEMRVDVGAVAKGYATERICEGLEAEGRTSLVINAGGNVRIIGKKPSGADFSVGIESPAPGEGGYSFILSLSDTAVVTSGSYQRYYTVNGKRYGHIIDRETLMPAERYLSVSVTVNDSALADVLSTALYVLDYEEGLALVKSIEGARAYWVNTDGSKTTSED